MLQINTKQTRDRPPGSAICLALAALVLGPRSFLPLYEHKRMFEAAGRLANSGQARPPNPIHPPRLPGRRRSARCSSTPSTASHPTRNQFDPCPAHPAWDVFETRCRIVSQTECHIEVEFCQGFTRSRFRSRVFNQPGPRLLDICFQNRKLASIRRQISY